MYQRYSVLTGLHGEHTSTGPPGRLIASQLQISMRCPHRYPFILLDASKEAIEIQHSIQECKHGDPARIRTREPLIKSPTPHRCATSLSIGSLNERHCDDFRTTPKFSIMVHIVILYYLQVIQRLKCGNIDLHDTTSLLCHPF